MRDLSVSSMYYILINSNVRNSDDSQQAIVKREDFIKGLKRVFLSDNILNFINILDEADSEFSKPELLTRVQSDVIMEKGDQRDFFHAHITVKIWHRTTLRLCTNDIAQYFNLKYDMSVYVAKPKIVPDYSITYQRYGEKSMENKPRLIIQGTLTYRDGDVDHFFNQYTK